MGNAVFATGIEAPEGPVCLPDGSMLLVEMSPATQCVTRLDPSGARSVVHRTGGRPNGLAIDARGNIWIAEAMLRAVICIAPDGRELARIGGGPNSPMLLPNDLAFGPDGHLYVTDSGMLLGDFMDETGAIRPGWEDIDYRGCIVEIDPATRTTVRTIDGGIRMTNGLAFGSDGLLYVNASLTGEVYRYDTRQDMPAREVFANVLREDERGQLAGPDGMAFGTDGRLYCTVHGFGHISVIDAGGSIAERLPCGPMPTNLAFVPGKREIRITEVAHGRVEIIPVPCEGLPLHCPDIASPAFDPANPTEATIQAFFRAMARNDWDTARELMAEDIRWSIMEAGIPGSGEHVGRDAVVAVFGEIRERFAPGSPAMTIRATATNGPLMMIEAHGKGELRDGRAFETDYVFAIEVHGGHIAVLREYMDSLYIHRLMGDH